MMNNTQEEGVPFRRGFIEQFIERFAVTRHFRNRQPDEIVLRILVQEGLENIEALTTQIAETLRDEVREFFPGEEDIRGLVSVVSEASGRTLPWTDPIFVDDITGGVIDKMLDVIGQSNEDVDLLDLRFRFLKHRAPTGAGDIPLPAKYPRKAKYETAWKTPDGVGCAAHALAFCMRGTSWQDDKRRNGAVSKRDGKKIMEDLGWGKRTSVDDFQDFVDLHKDRRVVVWDWLHMKNPSYWVYQGSEYVEEHDADGKTLQGKTLYVGYYQQVEGGHFFGISAPGAFQTAMASKAACCHNCFCVHDVSIIHTCGEPNRSKPKKESACPKCGGFHQLSGECLYVQCRCCAGIFKKKKSATHPDGVAGVHRCILYEEPPDEAKNSYQQNGAQDGKIPALFAYDFETRIVRKRVARTKRIETSRDAEGRYIREEHPIEMWVEELAEDHQVNMVRMENVYTNEQYVWHDRNGDKPVTRMLAFLEEYNLGFNHVVAHNASGYDAKILLHHAHTNYGNGRALKTIMNGQKVMQLVLGKGAARHKITFRDSLLHLPGSLAKLAKSFAPGVLAKGYFPHSFNKPENYDYVGEIPPREAYDIMFSAKSKKDVDDFNNWHDREKAKNRSWNFWYELDFYCKNDVTVLARIMKEYAHVSVEAFGLNPWFSSTAPSCVHKAHVIAVTNNTRDAHGLDELKREYPISFTDKISELAKTQSWAVQKPQEYAFDRKALRGGRTEIKQMACVITEEERAQGVEMRYMDVCSMYPYHQIHKDFPIGLPIVQIWDDDMRLCRHANCVNSPTAISCNHEDKWRFNKDITSMRMNGQPTVQEILDDESFFGIVCATVVPVKMLHPILPLYDEEAKKCLFQLGRIEKGVFDTPNFKYALSRGYKLERVHRLNKYTRAPSKWEEVSMKIYALKMQYSSAEPENLEELAREYAEKFGEDFGDIIRATRGKWENSPAKRQVFKIFNNCGWGKHAQRPVMRETKTFGNAEAMEEMEWCSNVTEGIFKYLDHTSFADNISYVYQNTANAPLNLINMYLPAAVFVPAYGRLQLAMNLEKLEASQVNGRKRVVMMDTDSIVSIYYPPDRFPGVYNIPEGEKLGDWTREDEGGGMVEFYGLGPKTYAYLNRNGKQSTPKAKGVRLGYVTSGIVNFENYKRLTRQFLASRHSQFLKVPQTHFNSHALHGIFTQRSYKKFGINVDEFKGEVDDEGYVWPFGYAGAPDAGELPRFIMEPE